MPQDDLYSSRQWRHAREKYLRLNPYCKICGLIGVKTRAVEVDHIRTVASGGAPLDPKNFSGKCKTHHSQKTRSLDMAPTTGGRNYLVTTGPDGYPIYLEKRSNGNLPQNPSPKNSPAVTPSPARLGRRRRSTG